MLNIIVSPTTKKSEILATDVPEKRKDDVCLDKGKEMIEGFGKWLSEDGKSRKTIESYVGDVAGLLAYLEKMETEFYGELKRFQITSYRRYLCAK